MASFDHYEILQGDRSDKRFLDVESQMLADKRFEGYELLGAPRIIDGEGKGTRWRYDFYATRPTGSQGH